MVERLKFQKRQRIRRVIGSRVTLGVLLVLVLLLVRATWNVYQKERETAQALKDAQARETELLQQQEFLAGEIERLQTEEGIEEEIRDRYGFAQSDERVIILIDDENSADQVEGEKGLWERIKTWFTRD